MGNCGIRQSSRSRRNPHNTQPVQNHPARPELNGNRFVFAAVTPYPHQYQNSNPASQYFPGYHTLPQVPLPYAHHSGSPLPNYGDGVANWVNGHYPYGPIMPPVIPYVEHQKAVTIQNDVNVKKESLCLEPDENNPGKYLVTFVFDATTAGSITVNFFVKEGMNCTMLATKECLPPPAKISFEQGLGQQFKQPSGAGIDLSLIMEKDARREGDEEIYPLAVTAEAYPSDNNTPEASKTGNSQITFANFEKKETDRFQVHVKKQILWVRGMRYELQEIYGIGNPADKESEGNESGKECVICLSEPRDTTVLPCRHLCMCSGCAKLLRFQTTRCPICRQPVDQLLEIELGSTADS